MRRLRGSSIVVVRRTLIRAARISQLVILKRPLSFSLAQSIPSIKVEQRSVGHGGYERNGGGGGGRRTRAREPVAAQPQRSSALTNAVRGFPHIRRRCRRFYRLEGGGAERPVAWRCRRGELACFLSPKVDVAWLRKHIGLLIK